MGRHPQPYRIGLSSIITRHPGGAVQLLLRSLCAGVALTQVQPQDVIQTLCMHGTGGPAAPQLKNTPYVRFQTAQILIASPTALQRVGALMRCGSDNRLPLKTVKLTIFTAAFSPGKSMASLVPECLRRGEQSFRMQPRPRQPSRRPRCFFRCRVFNHKGSRARHMAAAREHLGLASVATRH